MTLCNKFISVASLFIDSVLSNMVTLLSLPQFTYGSRKIQKFMLPGLRWHCTPSDVGKSVSSTCLQASLQWKFETGYVHSQIQHCFLTRLIMLVLLLDFLILENYSYMCYCTSIICTRAPNNTLFSHSERNQRTVSFHSNSPFPLLLEKQVYQRFHITLW